MRYGIFSDIHSNLEAFDSVIRAYKSEAIDRYLCIGDVIGYATNPKECIKKVNKLAMITVAGNHDWAAVNLFSLDYFNETAKEALLWTRSNIDHKDRIFLESLKLTYKNKELTLVHGTLDNPQEFNYMTDGYIAEETFRILDTNICFVGHTHHPGAFIKDKDESIHYRQDDSYDIKPDNKYIINVGSVGQPRDGNPKAAYCIYDSEKREVRIKRIVYDFESSRKKIIELGLAKFLGDRLLLGR